jgi:hypothetical protein
MTTYQMLVAAHGLIGTVALITFWLAAGLRKGSPMHRRVGQAYLLAMLGIIVTALPMAWVFHGTGRTGTAAFLAYLVVITAAGVWSQWRAIRDKGDVVRYTGAVYLALGVLSLLAGLGVLLLGIRTGSPLLMGFSGVGVSVGIDRLRKRLRRDRLAARPRWWMVEHYNAVLGNGIATHIAFLAIGLPRLLPAIGGGALTYVAWFGPVLVAIVAKVWLDRRWRPAPRTAPTLPHAAAAR